MASPHAPAATLHYEMIQTRGLRFEVATHGEGDRLALLLHGFPESAHSYRYQIPLLTRLGYRVWAPNLRGYGKTDKPRGRRAYTLAHLEADVTDLIDASGARSVTLIGHDWGGAIAWHYGAYGSRPLERLVVMNCPHPACMQRELRHLPQLKRSWYMFFFQLPWLPEALIRRNDYALFEQVGRGWAVHKENILPEDVAALRESARQPGALTSMLNYYRALPWSLAQQARSGVRKVQVPTLLLWGEQDRALGRELTVGTERFAPALTLRFLPDASHWVQQDDPRGVNTALEGWLTRSASA
ncbi:MAG: alpha/beta hydrolase [Polyangiales bacterium]